MANEVRGGRLLRQWVEADESRSYRALAAAVGVTTQSLYEWRTGMARPELPRRELLRALTGIDPDVWASVKEKRAAREAAKRLERIRSSGAV